MPPTYSRAASTIRPSASRVRQALLAVWRFVLAAGVTGMRLLQVFPPSALRRNTIDLLAISGVLSW